MSAPPGRSGRQAGSGAALIATAALLWATIGLFSPPLFERGLSPQQVAFWRAAWAGIFFVVHASSRSVWPRERRSVLWLTGFGVVGVGVFYWALQAAIETGGVSLAWLLLYTAPAWVALAAPTVLGERVTRRTLVLVATTLVGVVLVATGGGDGIRVTAASVGWGLLSGVTYATWYLISQRAGTGPVATAAVAIPVGALVLLPAAGWPGWQLVGVLAVFAFATSYLPALAYYAGIQRTTATRASIVATIEPVAALGLAWLAFDERLGGFALVGAGLVLAAALLAASASE